MDVTLEDLLKKSGLAFDKIKGSTKRADVLETLAKRAGVEVDVVLIAMWETQWDDMVEEEGGEVHESPEKETQPEKPPEPEQLPGDVSFTDPVKGSVIRFMAIQDSTGLCYSVNGDPRPAITRIKLSIHTRGPRLDFPELKTAATIPWEGSQQIIIELMRLADTQGVEHNFPANGVLNKPEPRVQPQQPHPKVDVTNTSPQSSVGSPLPVRNPNLITISASDGEFMSVRQGTIASLVSATYGDCYRVVDCVRSIPLNAGGFVIQVSAMALGVQDFSLGTPKKLEVSYMPAMGQQGTPQQNLIGGLQGTPQSMPQMSLSSQRLSVGPIVIEDEDGDEDPVTERSTGSYRHDPYNPRSSRRDNNSVVDDLSEFSMMDDESMSRRTSDMSPEDLARYSNPSTDRPNRAFVSTPNGEMVYIPQGTITKVVRAVYGEGTLWVLATEAARAAVVDGGINGLLVSEESLGVEDPSPGKTKNLVVIYRPVQMQPQPVAPPIGYTQSYPSADEVSTQHI